MNEHITIILQRIVDSCTQCGLCQGSCTFLKEFDIDPKELAERLIADEEPVDPSLLYSCTLCGTCRDVCPEGIDVGKLMLCLREDRLERGEESLPAHEWVKERQEWISSNVAFCLDRGPEGSGYERVFFPGCTLAEYNPRIVLDTYEYLKEKNPSTGIILDCCGAPFEGVGDKVRCNQIITSLGRRMYALGARHIITACPTCYRMFRGLLPQYEVSTVYEIMDNEGLEIAAESSDQSFFLFHPCSTRHNEKVTRAVSNLIKKMGYRLAARQGVEERSACCGMGGMVAASNPVLAMVIAQEQTEGVTDDIVTYCATCRDALVNFAPTFHVLDLVFNPQWNEHKEQPPAEDSQKKKNLQWLRAQLKQQQENDNY